MSADVPSRRTRAGRPRAPHPTDNRPHDNDVRAQVDDHVFIAIDRLAHLYVTGQLDDDATVYNKLYLIREHIDAALAAFDQRDVSR